MQKKKKKMGMGIQASFRGRNSGTRWNKECIMEMMVGWPTVWWVLFCFFVTLALNGAWVYASIKRWKTKEEGMPLAVSRPCIYSVFRNHVAYWVVSSVGLLQGAVYNVFGYSQQHTTELMFLIATIALIAIFWPSVWLAQTLATRTTCSEDPSCRVA
jgi:dipeptide/tripeptide permease